MEDALCQAKYDSTYGLTKNVGAPHLVRPIDHETTQKIRVNNMVRMTAAGVWRLVNRLDPHQAQQPSHRFAVHRPTVPAQHCHQFGKPCIVG
jgi:hypothetical protein